MSKYTAKKMELLAVRAEELFPIESARGQGGGWGCGWDDPWSVLRNGKPIIMKILRGFTKSKMIDRKVVTLDRP